MRGRKVWSSNTTCLEGCCVLVVKLHVLACNGLRQVSAPIGKSLYICISLHEHSLTQIYRLFLIGVEAWWWPLQAEACSFIVGMQHLSK